MEPKTQKSRETRARLLREGAQLFSVKGYFLTTVDDVMAKAALTKGGFYAHFASKEDLGRAVIEHATGIWVERVVQRIAGVTDPREQLRALLEAYRAYAVDRTFEGGCFFVNLAIEMDDQHEEFRRLIDERFAQFRMVVMAIVQAGKAASVFRADTPEEALATVVVGYLTGTMMQAKASKDFGLFDGGNRLMIELITSFETPAPAGATSS
jgi:TetR/AcrR family transcriptional regulator, transcriptional repressor for nem operon